MSISAAGKVQVPSQVAAPPETRKSSSETSPWLAAGFRATKASPGNVRSGRVVMGQKYMTNPASMLLVYGPINYPKAKTNFKAEQPFKHRDRLAEALLKQPEPDLNAAATALLKLQLLQKRGRQLPQLEQAHLANADQMKLLGDRAEQFATLVEGKGYAGLAKILREVFAAAAGGKAGAAHASADILANARDSLPADPLTDGDSFKSLQALAAAHSQQDEPVRNKMEGLIAGIHSAAFIQDPQDWLKVSWIDTQFKDQLAASGAPPQVQANACRQYATAYLEKMCGWLDMADKFPGNFSAAEQALVGKAAQLRADLLQLTNPRTAAETAGDKAGTYAFGLLLRSSPEQRSAAIAMLQKTALLRTQDDWLGFMLGRHIDIPSDVIAPNASGKSKAQAYAQYMKGYVKAVKDCAAFEQRSGMPGSPTEDLVRLAALEVPVAELARQEGLDSPPPPYQAAVANRLVEVVAQKVHKTATEQADALWQKTSSVRNKKVQTKMRENVRNALHALCEIGAASSKANPASARKVVYKLMIELGSTKKEAKDFSEGLEPKAIGQFVNSLAGEFKAYLQPDRKIPCEFGSDTYWLVNHKAALASWNTLALA